MRPFLLATIIIVAASQAMAYDNVEMLCLVNRERQRYGLSNLGGDYRLDDAAQGHCNWQADSLEMTHYGDGDPGSRVDAAGYNWQSVAENVAYGYSDEVECMHQWMNSAGHRDNILGQDYTHFGSAVGYSNDGTPYYTQDFGGDGNYHNYPECPGNRSYGDESYADGGSDDGYSNGGLDNGGGASNYDDGSNYDNGSNYDDGSSWDNGSGWDDGSNWDDGSGWDDGGGDNTWVDDNGWTWTEW